MAMSSSSVNSAASSMRDLSGFNVVAGVEVFVVVDFVVDFVVVFVVFVCGLDVVVVFVVGV